MSRRRFVKMVPGPGYPRVKAGFDKSPNMGKKSTNTPDNPVYGGTQHLHNIVLPTITNSYILQNILILQHTRKHTRL